MNTIQEVNPAQAYFEGMLWAAFGVKIFTDNVAEHCVSYQLLRILY